MSAEAEINLQGASKRRDGYSAPNGNNVGAASQTRSEFDFLSADRHSQRVRMLKFGLPFLALFGTGFFSAATFFSNSEVAALSTTPVAMKDGRIIMANPKLEGYTGDKRPYKMVANRAIQENARSTLIELQQIRADLPFGKSATAKLLADTGFFDNAAGKLDLTNAISLVTSDGMTAKLSSAKINITTSEMSTMEPVDIKTDGSHITADRMQISDGGKVIIFESRVRLNIDAKKVRANLAEPESQ